MKQLITLLLGILITSSSVLADYDPVLEAEEAAQRAAAQRESQRRKAEADRIKAEAMAKYHAEDMARKRKHIGSLANGKSDAEVENLYNQKVKADTDAMNANIADAQQKMNSAEVQAQMKATTGKSMQEIMNMSPEEQEAFAAEMEKKFAGME